TFVRMIAEWASGIGAEAASLARLQLLLRDQRHRAIEADGEHIITGLKIGVRLAMLDVGAEAADTGQDRLAILGMLADCAWQRKEAERALQIDVVGRETLGDAGALGLLAVHGLAQLDVGAEAAGAQRDFEAARRILAELLHAAVGRAVA